MSEKLKDCDFDEKVLKSTVPVLLDFYADWCGPCKMLSPIIDSIAAELKDKAAIYKVNVDEEAQLAAKFGIMNIPSLVVFKNGEQVSSCTGMRSKNDIIAMLS